MKESKRDKKAICICQDFDDIKLNKKKLKSLIGDICKRNGVKKYSVNVAIVDDAAIIKINKKFLRHNKTTDVISFDLTGEEEKADKNFELIINAQQAIREADARGHSPQSEVALYITHGLLHQLGFDDLDAAEAKKMHAEEDRILQENDFPSVYYSKD